MRIGVSLAQPRGRDAFTWLCEQLRRAVDDGFTSAWLANIFGLDSLTALAVAGSQVPGIELGTAVVPTYPRHPAALAQQALTVAAATEGRLTLGIGLSHKIVIEDMYGYSFERPARHMREYLSILLPLLDGQRAKFSGETLRGDIGLSVPRRGRVPVVLAALAPHMLRLAGERTDGTVTYLTGPATIAGHIVPAINAAARAAGRPRPRVVCILPVCVTDDPARVRARAAKTFAFYGGLPSYRAMLDREGAADPADVAIVGDEARVMAQIGRLSEAGVTDFIAAQFTSGDDAHRTRAMLKSLAAGSVA